jgi:hypothetical protein
MIISGQTIHNWDDSIDWEDTYYLIESNWELEYLYDKNTKTGNMLIRDNDEYDTKDILGEIYSQKTEEPICTVKQALESYDTSGYSMPLQITEVPVTGILNEYEELSDPHIHCINIPSCIYQKVKKGIITETIRKDTEYHVDDKLFLIKDSTHELQAKIVSCRKIHLTTGPSPFDKKIYLDGNEEAVVVEKFIVEGLGFKTIRGFFDHFEEIYGLPFEGILIKWKLDKGNNK